MGEQYHLLPSQVAEEANIFDIMAMDIKSAWDEYQRATPAERANMAFKGKKSEDIQKMYEEIRNGAK